MSEESSGNYGELILTSFFEQHRHSPRDLFLQQYNGAFLLSRSRQYPPKILFMPKVEGLEITLGTEDSCSLVFGEDSTVDGLHTLVTYHEGFKGWIIKDNNTRFGMSLNRERLNPHGIHLLKDREEIQLGRRLSRVQFYLAQTLYDRMENNGVIRLITNKQPPIYPGGETIIKNGG